MLIATFDSFDAYHQALNEKPELSGTSPINTAGILGISRQGVHIAIKRGFLDVVKIEEERGRVIQIVTRTSIEHYSQIPARGRPPKVFPTGKCASRWRNYKAYAEAQRA